MKKRRLLFTVMALSATSLTAFSQGAVPTENPETSGYITPKSQYGNNWFISIGAGPSLLIGEQDFEQPVGDRIKFSGELSVGKWFSPNFGMRLQLMGGSLKGFNFNSFHEGNYVYKNRNYSRHPIGFPNDLKYTDDGKGFWQEFNYGTFSFDLMGNLTNLFRGYYREKAPVEFIPYVGLGMAITNSTSTTPSSYDWLAKLGMRVNFNLGQRWAIYLEPQANITNKEFDGYIGNRDFDGIVNTMVGLQLNLNKGFKEQNLLSIDEINLLNNKINGQRQMIENHQDILERQQQLLDKLNGCCEEGKRGRQEPSMYVSYQNDKTYLPEYIRFGLNSSRIEMSEQHKVEDAVAYLNANPESKLLLIGYADKKTGNSNYNYKLSCKRVETVAAAMAKAGISSNRLIIKCIGDKEQPYDQNDWNRVVVMVERK